MLNNFENIRKKIKNIYNKFANMTLLYPYNNKMYKTSEAGENKNIYKINN